MAPSPRGARATISEAYRLPTLKALAAQGCHVLAHDRVGYGYSDGRQDEAYTVKSNARELLALLENAKLQDATIAGWSYGGSAA